MNPLPGLPFEAMVHQGASLRLERLAHGVLRLVLARPQARNAFHGAMVQELAQTLALALATGEARVLLLEGEGPVFCAGADLAWMKAQASTSREANLEDALAMGRMFHALAAFPAPVLARVQGAAVGGGLGLCACADFVLAHGEARFATSEVRLGLVPAVISPYVVRRVGLAAASPLLLSGRPWDAGEAREAGLVHRVEAPGTSRETALGEALEAFLQAGPRAARATKALLLAIHPLPGPDLLEATARAIASARSSPEGQGGLEAHFRKGAPPWSRP